MIAIDVAFVFKPMKRIKKKRMDFSGLNVCANNGFMRIVTVT